MAIDRSMGRGALLSALFHIGVALLVFFGLPQWIAPEDFQQPVAVQLATLADISTPPKSVPPSPAPAPVEKPVPPAPPVPPQPQAEAPPPAPPAPTPPVPEPAPEVTPPEPQPQEAVPEPKPAEQQQAEIQPKIVPPQKPKPPQPKPDQNQKPKPQEDALASLLKNVEKLKDQPDQTRAPQPTQQPAQPQPQQNLTDAPLTMSEIDAIRQQIERCWNIPAGARDAENLVVEIRVVFNPDGSVARAEIVDTSRMATDSFYRAAAESAYRAVLQCSPLQMPAKKYNVWKIVTLRFNPKEMLGT